MVIQFSYVTWFSSVFPLAGLFALLNNVVEIRSDAFKICMSFQRPIGERVRNIGAWQVGTTHDLHDLTLQNMLQMRELFCDVLLALFKNLPAFLLECILCTICKACYKF